MACSTTTTIDSIAGSELGCLFRVMGSCARQPDAMAGQLPAPEITCGPALTFRVKSVIAFVTAAANLSMSYEL
jgi:hypothetical protein